MTPLILASRSRARIEMLGHVGLSLTAHPADLDEAAITMDAQARGVPVDDIASLLAFEKACVVSRQYKGAYVIGSDQLLHHRGALLDKARDKEDAIRRLHLLRGDMHELIASVCVVRDGDMIWSHIDRARLTMKNLSDAQIERYAECAGAMLTDTVGAYALEREGAWLFEKIEGDFFTILGMPLLPLLSFLEKEGFGP